VETTKTLAMMRSTLMAHMAIRPEPRSALQVRMAGPSMARTSGAWHFSIVLRRDDTKITAMEIPAVLRRLGLASTTDV